MFSLTLLVYDVITARGDKSVLTDRWVLSTCKLLPPPSLIKRHALKTYMGSGDTAPPILNLGQMQVTVVLSVGKWPPEPI